MTSQGRTRPNYPRRRAPVACHFCRYRKRKCDSQRPACGLCAVSGVDCEYPEPSEDTRQNPTQASANLPVDALLRRLDQLENMFKQQNGQRQESQPTQDGDEQPTSERPTPGSAHQDEGSPSSHGSPPQQTPPTDDLTGQSTDSPTPNLTDSTLPTTVTDGVTITASDTDQGNQHEAQGELMSDVYDDSMLDNIQGFVSYLSSHGPAMTASHPVEKTWVSAEPPYPVIGHGQRCITCGRSDSRLLDDAPITIPIGHHTSTGSMFALEPVRRLIGDYPRDFFYQVETCRTSIPELSSRHDLSLLLASVDFIGGATDGLISSYFTNINSTFPILDKTSFTDLFHRTLRGDQCEDVDAAVCLVVLALGKLTSTDYEDVNSTNHSYGLEYFIPAYQILTTQWVTSFGTDLSLPTGLVLSAIYMSCLARPLLAWKLVYMASSKLQMMVPSRNQGSVAFSNAENETVGRLFWACFLLECIKPDLSHNVPTDAHEASLRLRYWSARHIISRPCLVYILSVSTADEIPTYVYKYAETCIQSCRNYIETALQVLTKRTPYVWAICQACLATSFVLATSSDSPILKHLVPDIEGIVSRLIVGMQRWASPESSIESIICILQSIHQKQRLAKLKRRHPSTSLG
ncbi:Echinocandin B biosynthetic cluster transcription factor ecdB [Colletotrichum fructicola]|nr:Echinocandin B biosynthetic cluster transcription factor ecdB [Colletotrichum fructicola]